MKHGENILSHDPAAQIGLSRRESLRELAVNCLQISVAVLALIFALPFVSKQLTGKPFTESWVVVSSVMFILASIAFSSFVMLFSYYERLPKIRITARGLAQLACALPLVIGVIILIFPIVRYFWKA